MGPVYGNAQNVLRGMLRLEKSGLAAPEPESIDLDRLCIRKINVLRGMLRTENSGLAAPEPESIDLDKLCIRKTDVLKGLLRLENHPPLRRGRN